MYACTERLKLRGAKRYCRPGNFLLGEAIPPLLRHKYASVYWRMYRCILVYALQVSLYEVLREGATTLSAAESVGNEDEDGLRLIHRRRVNAVRTGWQVFKIRNVIQRWVNDPSTNRGTCWLFLRRQHAMAHATAIPSVRLSVCHTRALYQNG